MKQDRTAFKIAATEVIVNIDGRNVDCVCLTSTFHLYQVLYNLDQIKYHVS